jgi:hypothetical protein
VVGGLVQQQHVGLRRERARQQHPAPEAAGQVGEGGIALQPEPVERGGQAPGFQSRLTVGNDVGDAAAEAGRHFLFEPSDAHAALDPDFAVIGLQFAGQQLEQRRFSGAVAPDQGDAFAGIERKTGAFQQQGTADAVVDVLEGDQWHARIVGGDARIPLECRGGRGIIRSEIIHSRGVAP